MISRNFRQDAESRLTGGFFLERNKSLVRRRSCSPVREAVRSDAALQTLLSTVRPWRRNKLSAAEGRTAQRSANNRGRSKLPTEGLYCQDMDAVPRRSVCLRTWKISGFSQRTNANELNRP